MDVGTSARTRLCSVCIQAHSSILTSPHTSVPANLIFAAVTHSSVTHMSRHFRVKPHKHIYCTYCPAWNELLFDSHAAMSCPIDVSSNAHKDSGSRKVCLIFHTHKSRFTFYSAMATDKEKRATTTLLNRKRVLQFCSRQQTSPQIVPCTL